MGIWGRVSALLRGGVAGGAEAVAAPHLGRVLEQQIRDASADLVAARRALAVAVAAHRADAEAQRRTLARASDLEARVVAALSAGDERLASEGAAEIARLEGVASRAADALDRAAERISRQEALVAKGQERLDALAAGRREAASATAVLAASRMSGRGGASPSSLAAAEETLRLLRERIEGGQAVSDALEEQAAGSDVALRLAAAGHGPPTAQTAQAVLERLRPRALLPAPPG